MRQLLPLVVALLGLVGCSDTSTPLSVTNRSAAPLEQVVVSGSGFRQSLGTIEPGDTATAEIRPKGETGIGISFNSGTRRVSLPPQGYFEGGGTYAVTVVVAPNLEVTADATLRPY